jgi:pimeloyl-ACP methyl ester carboxylesterase
MQLAGLPVAVYLPLENMSTPTASDRPAVQVLFVLHGMFMNGGAFAKNLLGFARQNHMLLIAPTFHYESNFKDPQIITSEDTTLTAKLNQIAAQIETQTGIPLKLHFLFYGFSRGAQLAHHYAMLFPEKTLGVVAMSGGAYTLPYREYPSDRKSGQSLPFPFGVVGLSHYDGHSFDQTTFDRIHFLIEVGANDTNPNDVSRAWDPYIGNNRLIRAQHFYQALKQLGVNAQLTVFPGTFHQVTPAMTKAALSFFSKLTS